jgi:hypothetical protein
VANIIQSTVVIIGLLTLSACSSTPPAEQAEPSPRVKAETIEAKGKYGTIKEERVKAMNSEVRFVPNGQKGYRMVDPSLEDAKESAHRDSDKLVIPSWTLGSW